MGQKGVGTPFLTPAKAVRFRHEQRVSRGDVGGEICHALMAKRGPDALLPSAPPRLCARLLIFSQPRQAFPGSSGWRHFPKFARDPGDYADARLPQPAPAHLGDLPGWIPVQFQARPLTLSSLPFSPLPTGEGRRERTRKFFQSAETAF